MQVIMYTSKVHSTNTGTQRFFEYIRNHARSTLVCTCVRVSLALSSSGLPCYRPHVVSSVHVPTGAAHKASVNIITSARVTSISYVKENPASDSPDADGDHLSKAQQQQARFELAFTTATPLPPDMRKTLGVVAGAAAAAAAESEAAASADGANGSTSTGGTSNTKEPYRIHCDYVLQATGAAREGHGWARRLGHAVSDPVPSLFTLTIKDPR